ncbi:MAG: TRAP transporter small permease subunit [Xanthomonadales bacterium]|nr:TRAP transporter small permease subunit [Xanthomonadales bacterium]
MDTLETWVARIGQAVAWLTLVMVVLTFCVVVLRYGFSLGWIALQETVTYLHASVFMLAAAWTLQAGGHVRVDIFYRRGSDRHRAIVDLLGAVLLLIPFCVFLLAIGWTYVLSSWKLLEGSREAGGLPLVYLLKTLILLLPALLLLQSIPFAARNWRALRTSG